MKTIIINTLQTHPLGIQAHALIMFAKQDKRFASLLYQQLSYYLPTETFSVRGEVEFKTVSPFLIPVDFETAEARLSWLLQELSQAEKSEVAEVWGVLDAWRSDKQFPQDLVLGIVGLAIIGPTLGLISRKKKKKSKLRILINEHSYNELSSGKIYQLLQNASNRLVATALTKVDGDTKRLEPDLYDWLYSDQEIEVSTLSEAGLRQVMAEAESEELPIEIISFEETPIAITLSPVIRSEFEETFEPKVIK